VVAAACGAGRRPGVEPEARQVAPRVSEGRTRLLDHNLPEVVEFVAAVVVRSPTGPPGSGRVPSAARAWPRGS
jgi:hypothetical protein